MGNTVAIVGRPNVGKSTLFNRLTESRDAIIDPTSGVTRDRHYGNAEWCGVHFSVIDTGGLTINDEDVFEGEIRKQVQLAIQESNVILFLTDVTTGITDLDLYIANMLRKQEKPVLLVVNKVDSNEKIIQASEFYGLGLGEVYCISSVNGGGTGDMLDAMLSHFKESPVEPEADLPRIAIVGKPNVGKSSFVNALLGVERNIVTDVAGTTRDSIHTRFNQFGLNCILVDTAGIRKRSKVTEDIEFYSVVRSVKSIEQSDVCIMMIDANEGMQKQDLSIYYTIERNSKGVVLAVNKWDVLEKDAKTLQEYERSLREALAPFNDVPILFISAKTRQRVLKVLETALEVYANRTQKVPTSKLNEVMLEIIENQPPPTYKGKTVRIKYVMQLPTFSPAIAFYCNLPQYVKDPYKRFLENKLREHFNFTGVPLRLFFRKK